MVQKGNTPALSAVSLGGGTNSSALIVELVNRGTPPDLALFADTGSEMPHTYAFLGGHFIPWLQAHGIHYAQVHNGGRVNKLGRWVAPSLGNDCIRTREIPGKAHGLMGCSVKWKRQPMDKFLKSYPPALKVWKRKQKVRRLLGIDAGEPDRGKVPDDALFTYHRPLVDWGLDRDDCAAILDAAGLPQPGKSACSFCPSTKKGELHDMRKDHPELFRQAVLMEHNWRTGPGYRGPGEAYTQGLGRNWSWEAWGKADAAQGRLFQDPPDEPCVTCYDG